ncbi:zinc ribbon domain-containing protein [Clostridium pasteurianum]|uniref:zinc ribbon domain-containing protein n=1 Tax=Clostridium pasteurianum TaxID=1501 RepID=UPI002260B511|nr:zinc ribbon domain-containing protein [Clostridium pasteurianum]UZW14349.1 zinc ribbon domain-containing protein [Clostridium pasteurianum]
MLIKCPECQKEISDKAKSCPNCGYPISSETIKINDIEFPNLSNDLSIGKQIVNWTYDAAIDGLYENSGNTYDKFPSGKIKVLLFKNGIRICGSFYRTLVEIHYSQIISVEEIRGNEIKDKSTIGRAVIGGVVFGYLGAIIGGMSGIGTKNVNVYYLVINYWDTNTKQKCSISIACNVSSKRFINRLNKEKSKNKFL